MDPQWQRVFDSQYKSYYWYNSTTKESHWEVELEQNPEYNEKVNRHKQGSEYHEALESNIQNVRSSMGSINRSYNSGNNTVNIEMVDVSLDVPSVCVNENDKLLSSPNEKARVSANAEVMRRTTLVTTSYQICVYMNAFLFEGPFGVLEAGVRSFCLLCLALLLLLVRYTFTSSLHKLMLDCFKECIISFAAGISLIIPGMACFIYYKYNANDDWDLSPFPSIIGWVDPRRFIIFTIVGGGSLARNVKFHGDESIESVKKPLTGPTITTDMILGIISRENDCQDDFWYKKINDSNHALLCAPRIMTITFSKIIRGEYSNDVLS